MVFGEAGDVRAEAMLGFGLGALNLAFGCYEVPAGAVARMTLSAQVLARKTFRA